MYVLLHQERTICWHGREPLHRLVVVVLHLSAALPEMGRSRQETSRKCLAAGAQRAAPPETRDRSQKETARYDVRIVAIRWPVRIRL